MKKFSRILALAVIILMLATMAVSCKKSGDDEDAAIADVADGDKSGTESDEKGDGEDTDNKDSDENDSEGADDKEGASAGDKEDGKTEDKKEDGKAEQQKPEGEQKGEGNGSYVESEDGTILETGDHEVNDDFVIQGAVTNDNGFIPDEEQGLEKSERYATEQSKYDFDKNPLINRDRQVNKGTMPSFDINDTGFVRAGTKVDDLKGKTLTFFTADNFAAWSYRNEKGETITEWDWFKDLKKEIGVVVKFTVKQHHASTNAVLQYMNAGKACDLIYSNHAVLGPQTLGISRSITSLININNLGSSPGVCKTTMDLCKWGNTLRVIAPIGVVDVLWYNQTLAQELGLSDPHTMWEKGVWDWEAFKNFQLSAPKTTKDGRELVARTEWNGNMLYTWDGTNGKNYVHIDSDAKVPTLINNWSDPQVIAAWEFIADVNKTVNYKCSAEDKTTGVSPEHLGLYLGTTLMSATMYTQVYRDTEYSKHVQINWVPFPKANTSTGKECCQYYGFGMLLPKKTSNEGNVNYALKFMELWATRFTETYFDNLNTFEYYNFNYKQRKQYFDFVTQHVKFTPAISTEANQSSDLWAAIAGNPAYNVKTEVEKTAKLHAAGIAESLKLDEAK